jgi:hypothetical protein
MLEENLLPLTYETVIQRLWILIQRHCKKYPGGKEIPDFKLI